MARASRVLALQADAAQQQADELTRLARLVDAIAAHLGVAIEGEIIEDTPEDAATADHEAVEDAPKKRR